MHLLEELLLKALSSLLLRSHVLITETASVDDLLRLVDEDTMHLRSDFTLVLFDKTAYVSQVELLNVHLGVNVDEILLESVYVSRNIDSSLGLGLLLEDQENS